jgi:hypothetical protein
VPEKKSSSRGKKTLVTAYRVSPVWATANRLAWPALEREIGWARAFGFHLSNWIVSLPDVNERERTTMNSHERQ